jgi:hypothetical protein
VDRQLTGTPIDVIQRASSTASPRRSGPPAPTALPPSPPHAGRPARNAARWSASLPTPPRRGLPTVAADRAER